ncbi:MAG: hypothetical protein ACYCZQ_03245 [Burkholderiales bacterium]
MSASTVAICNQALLGLGANLINSLSENSIESNACNVVWDNARRTTLSMNSWSFARKRIELGQDTTAPVFEYLYRYTLPSDLLRLVMVYQNTDYKIEERSIVTNANTCFIKYIFDNTDPATWPDYFSDLMAARLRLDLAYALTRSNTQITTSAQLFQNALRVARTLDGMIDIPDELGEEMPSMISIRG